jgi:hypothetical protein
VFFKWKCPICGFTNANLATSDGEAATGRRRALAALRTHVSSSDGGGHGARFEYPDGFDTDDMDRHVLLVSDRYLD